MAEVSNLKSLTMDINITSPPQSQLYAAVASWFKLPDDNDFQTGTLEFNPGVVTRPMPYGRTYSKPPTVITFFSKFKTGKDFNWRGWTYADSITTSQFTLNCKTWADSELNDFKVTWIVFPSDKAGVAGGVSSTSDIRNWDPPVSNNSAVVQFPAGRFTSNKVNVFMWSNRFDIAKSSSMRLRVYPTDISAAKFTWHTDSWGDTPLYVGERPG